MKTTDYLALAIATCGVGYLPLMPGTFGSLVGVAIFLALIRISAAAIVVAILFFTFAGIWAGTRTEKLSQRKDPGKIVVDEVAGQLIALLPLLFVAWSIKTVIVSFILFRFFDIVKPYPANRLQDLEGGVGVMCDDLVAGAYAAIIVSGVLIVYGT
ncbi:MAG TPA: phosphatidylglycerophosphatase A [Pyrinomonadaceae bacterium]|nr:phosphatidylglycerophosphatase A [Pyrinomonadaceae bacterium]